MTIFSTKSETEKAKINELLSSLTVLPLDEKSAKEAGEIEAELMKKGITIDPDYAHI